MNGGAIMTIFDIAYNDAIRNNDNSFLKELLVIQNGKYDIIDNEISSIPEICILIKQGSEVYYQDKGNDIKELDPIFVDLIKFHGYKHNLGLNIRAGNVKFLRKKI